jgi:hypothetical protein
MMSCFPRLVTANVACSEWSRYRKMRSTISEMLPTSFSKLSTLYTGIGRLNTFVVNRFQVTNTVSMNRSVAPQSRRAFMVCIAPVSVVCIVIPSSSEFDPGVAATMKHFGSRFSHFRHQRNREEVGFRLGTLRISSLVLSVEEIESDSNTSSTDNTAKRLFENNGGVLFTCCHPQNPLSPFRSLH